MTIDFYQQCDVANKILFDISHVLGKVRDISGVFLRDKVDARMFNKKYKLDPMDRICYCPVLTSFMGICPWALWFNKYKGGHRSKYYKNQIFLSTKKHS